MKIAIYGQFLSPENVEYAGELYQWLKGHNVSLLIYGAFKQHLEEEHQVKLSIPSFSGAHDIPADVDCIVSIGGDGTMLHAILFSRDSGIPLVGLNLGRLGFLSSIPKKEIEHALQALIQRKYTLDARTLLQVDSQHPLLGADNFALNEVTVLKRDSSSMIKIHVTLDGEFFNTYWSDGLIISTPTGSTGYSLSCGGPIILPDSSNFVITPIAPHNLSVRPVVIPDASEIRLTVESRTQSFLLSLDSRSYTLLKAEEIVIRKADFHIKLVKLQGMSFITTLRNKLLWGIDTRN